MKIKTGLFQSKFETIFCKTFFIILIIFFSYFVLRLFNPGIFNHTLALTGLKAVGAFMIFFVSLFIFYVMIVYIDKIFGNKINMIIGFVMFSGIIALEIFSIYYLRVNLSWDYGQVVEAAQNIATGNPIENEWYFNLFPFNINAAVFMGFSTIFFGGVKYGAYILNIVCISLAVLFSGLILKRIFGWTYFSFFMLFCVFTTPLWLYSPITYTDTLAMPFCVILVYLRVLAQEKKETQNILKAYISMGIYAAIAYLIKPTASIPFIAIIILDLIVFVSDIFGKGEQKGLKYKVITKNTNKKKNMVIIRLLPLIACVTMFILITFSFTEFTIFMKYRNENLYQTEFPIAFFIKQGLSMPKEVGGTSTGYGCYNDNDFFSTANIKGYEEKKQSDMRVINSRLSKLGFKGAISFFAKKLEWTWCDGTFFVANKLSRSPVQLTEYHTYILHRGDGKDFYFLLLAQLAQLSILFFSIITIIKFGFFGEHMTEQPKLLLKLISLSLTGILLFLLIWETRSRYLLIMLPLLNIFAVIGMMQLYQYVLSKFQISNREG